MNKKSPTIKRRVSRGRATARRRGCYYTWKLPHLKFTDRWVPTYVSPKKKIDDEC